MQTRPLTGYKREVLAWVVACRLATVRQVAWRFWGYPGLQASNAYRVVAQLVQAGLLAEHRLDRGMGRASQIVLEPTLKGLKAAGLTPPEAYKRRSERWIPTDGFLLQRTEMRLVRETEGWEWLDPAAVWPALRKAGLRRFSGRLLNSSERADRALLERMADPDLRLPALWHRASGAVRLVLEVEPEGPWRRRVKGLGAALGLLGSLDWELVGDNSAELAKARKLLESIHPSRRRRKTALPRLRITGTVYQVTSFRDRTDPRSLRKKAK